MKGEGERPSSHGRPARVFSHLHLCFPTRYGRPRQRCQCLIQTGCKRLDKLLTLPAELSQPISRHEFKDACIGIGK
jgi:hypothetical protein